MNLYNTFKKSCRLYPNNLAINDRGVPLTYAQLHKKIKQCSNLLYKVYTPSACAIVLPRGEQFISWQLAINSKNLIFSPVDPKTPIARQEFLMEMLRPSIVICEKDNTQLRLWCKNQNMVLLYKSALENTAIYFKDKNKIYPTNYHYIIFSSGSTGEPKAIALSDKGAVNTILEEIKVFSITSSDKVIWGLSPAFDASLADIYMALFSGASLYIPPFEFSNIKTFKSYLKENQITVADIPPALLPYLVKEPLPDLKTIIFGGEEANEGVVLELAKNRNMFNVYGPTETSIGASTSHVNKTPNWNSKCIGNPLLGFEFNLESPTFFPSLTKPTSQYSKVGELIISSKSQIAHEYINQASLTKEKFTHALPMSSFKTGDLVGWDGKNYFYLGRLDRQFKHLGNLVSPQEIERMANSYPGILASQAKYNDLDQKIILNCCLSPEIIKSYAPAIPSDKIILEDKFKKELRAFLTKGLPSYMIPGVLSFVELNTNQNGKTNL